MSSWAFVTLFSFKYKMSSHHNYKHISWMKKRRKNDQTIPILDFEKCTFSCIVMVQLYTQEKVTKINDEFGSIAKQSNTRHCFIFKINIWENQNKRMKINKKNTHLIITQEILMSFSYVLDLFLSFLMPGRRRKELN